MTATFAISILVLTLATVANAARKPRHSKGYELALTLNQRLRSTAMRGTGFALVIEARRYKLHPAFIAAAAGLESSYGAAMCEPFNAWGLGSCGRAWHPPSFASWRESISYFARWFRSRYPTARDPWSVGYSYCPPCGRSWGDTVARNMRKLGYAPDIRWPG